MNNDFSESYNETVGIDFCSKTMKMNDKDVRLQLWDTAGSERFRSLIPSYLKDSKAVIIFYDVTNKDSFDSVNMWLAEVREHISAQDLVFLVGNKSDLEESRQVSFEDGHTYANEKGTYFMETSARSELNIEPLFHMIA